MIRLEDAHLGGQYDPGEIKKRQESRRDRIKILAIGFTVLFLTLWALSAKRAIQKQPQYDTRCAVTRIIDGDTIECNRAPVRFRSIDAPEIWNVLDPRKGNASKAALEDLIPIGSILGLIIDSQRLADIYGRVLADIYLLDGTDIQELMVQQGHATYRENR